MTVRVDAYLHPIRMIYPIQPGSFFRAAPNWGKSAKHSLPQKLSNWVDVITVRSPFSSSITPLWGKPSNLWTPCVYSLWSRVPSWIWIRWTQYATHRNNFKSPPALAMSTATQNTAPTASHFIPGQHVLETFTLLFPNDQDHTFMDNTTFLSSTSKHDFCNTMATISHSHIQQCLNLTMHISLRHLAARMPSQLYNNFISFLPTRLAA